MGLFSNPRDNKKKWAKIVMPSAQNPELLNDGALYIATAEYIAGHARILYESVQLVMTSENKKTREQRYALAADHRRALKKVRKFADKTQKKEADKALKAFDDMENCLNQIERDKAFAKEMAKRQRKDEFWDTYAAMEMIDIFAGNDDKKE